MLIYLFLSLFQLTSASDTALVQQSKAQAEYYIYRIEEKKNIDENLWALTVLSSQNSAVESFIKRKVGEEAHSNELLDLFKNPEPTFDKQLQKIVLRTGSSNLLVALLLEIEGRKNKEEIYEQFKSRFTHSKIKNIDYDNLCRSIIEKKEISSDVLPTNRFLLPHFFLLFDDELNSLISDEYLRKIAPSWGQTQKHQFTKSILHQVSLLRVFYLLYSYSEINALYSPLVNSKLFPNSSLKLRIYQYLDYSMYRLGYYDRSLNIVRNFTQPLAKYLNRQKLKLRIKELNGVYLYSIGKIKSAEKIYEEILSETKKKDYELGNFSSLYNNLALAKFKLGKYDQYLDLQFQSLRVAKENNNYSHQFEILNNLFVYYRQSKDATHALDYLKKAQKLAQANENQTDIGKVYTSLGSFHRQFKNNFKLAYRYFSKAEKVLDPRNDKSYYLDLLNEEAQTFEDQGKYTKALKKHSQIIRSVPDKNSPDYIDALVNKTRIYLKIGNTRKASELIQTFKSFDLDKLYFEQIVKAKTAEANFLRQTENSEQALQILMPTLTQVVERAQNSADLQSGYWHIEVEYLNAFKLAVQILRDNNRPGEAVYLLDKLKTINDASLYQNPLVKSSVLNESELTQYKQLTARLDATRKKLLTASESQKFAIQHDINQLKLKKRQLDKKLTSGIETRPLSVREVQNHLSARELVLHITELKNQFYIAKITRSEVSIKTVPIDSALKRLLLNSVQQVSTHNTNLDSLYTITNTLGIEHISDRIQKVTIIPDSYFYQLPIDILPVEKPVHSYSYGAVKYAIEKFDINYLTSLNDFIKKPTNPEENEYRWNFVGYGVSNFGGYKNKSLVPLPFAQKEVTSIADKLSNLSGTRFFINEASTKAAFTQTAPDARILHLATHSEVSERDPLFSTIYLSKAGNTPDSTFEDQVFAYELFELHLNNEMIMLNSCDSGSGSYIQGTGVMGISRALQYAGANSLLLNLWSVNDMLASDFAIHFYEQLNKGQTKAEALRNTKRYFLRNKNASPHFWGPYMLIGDTDPIVAPYYDTNLAVAGTFLVYFLLMVGLSYLKGRGYFFKKEKDKAA